MLSIQRIDRSVNVLEAFSSIVLNESNTSFLENYIWATFETLKKSFKNLFISVLVDENFKLDRSISLDGSCLLFLIHNFIRTVNLVTLNDSVGPIPVLVHLRGCGGHLNCVTVSVSAEVQALIDPVLEIINNRPDDKIGMAQPPPVVVVLMAAKKLGAEYTVLRSGEAEVTFELHIPLVSS